MSNLSGTVRLNIETYLAGKNQPTHPSVVAFIEPWNGYKYWMAYSPYPFANGEEENPCIAVSNDLLYWDIPTGFLNPIANNEETGCDELKDPHILYREDLNRLEVWYLGRLNANLGGDGKTLLIFRKTSIDGIHWSKFEILTDTKYLSPSVIWENGKYKLWEIGFSNQGTQGKFVYRESYDGISWSKYRICSLNGMNADLKMWHGSVSKEGNIYHFVFVEKMVGSKLIMHCTSYDGISFSAPEELIILSKQWNYIYRPFLLCSDKGYACVYGVVNRDNAWYLSMNRGEELESIQGISEREIVQMKDLSDTVIDTNTLRYYIKFVLKSINSAIRIELLSLVIPITGILLMTQGASYTFGIGLVCIVFCIVYLTRMKVYNHILLFAQIVAGVIEGISIMAIALLFVNTIL